MRSGYSAKVTIGLLDGRERVGRLMTPYAPELRELPLLLAPDPKNLDAKSVRLTLGTSRIMYVAFHRYPGEHIASAPGPASPVGVHPKDREAFVVQVPDKTDDIPAGFFAYPCDTASPYTEFFFYADSVVRREENERIGGMLVREGLISAEQLDEGLATQAADRAKTIGDYLVARTSVTPGDVDRAVSRQQQDRSMRLGDILVEEGLASRDEVEAAVDEQTRARGKRLGEVLVDMGVLSERALMEALSSRLCIPLVDLDDHAIDPAAIESVERALLEKHDVLPTRSDENTLELAIADPFQSEAPEILSLMFGKTVEQVLVLPSQLRRARKQALGHTTEPPELPPWGSISVDEDDDDVPSDEFVIPRDSLVVGPQDGLPPDPPPPRITTPAPTPEDIDPSPDRELDDSCAPLADQIMSRAVEQRATDVHIEPNGASRPTVVRFRVNGKCVLHRTVAAEQRHVVTAAFQAAAGLDPARKTPRQGRGVWDVAGEQIELVVHSIPTLNGDSDVAVRMVASTSVRALEGLGMSPENLSRARAMMDHTSGLILCAGPRRSGRTTSLHALLDEVNRPERKVWTIEEPIELTQPGLRQVQIDRSMGADPDTALQACLASDADVIMIGELRGAALTTAAVDAATSGHLVVAGVHADSAVDAVRGLIAQVGPGRVADALVGVIGVRVLAAPCRSCASPRSVTEDETAAAESVGEAIDGLQAWTTAGCDACHGRGLAGQTGLQEIALVEESVRAALRLDAGWVEALSAAGLEPVVRDAVGKARAGLCHLTDALDLK